MCYGHPKHVYLYLTIHHYPNSGLLLGVSGSPGVSLSRFEKMAPRHETETGPLSLILVLDFSLGKKLIQCTHRLT